MTCSYQLNHHYKFEEDYSFFILIYVRRKKVQTKWIFSFALAFGLL